MKKVLFVFCIFLFIVSNSAAQSANNFVLSGTYFKANDADLNFYGGKVGYVSKTSANVFWGLFLEFQGAEEKYTEITYQNSYVGMITRTNEKTSAVTLLKLGVEANIFPGDSKNFFVGFEAFYISGKSKDATDDGYGLAPKAGIILGDKSVNFIFAFKYDILKFSENENDPATKGIGLEAGVLIPF